MKDTVAAKRYAEAFLSYARDTIGVERAVEDCRNIKALIHDNPEFLPLLSNPVMTHREKGEFLDRLLGGDFSRETLHFLRLLIEKRRINELAEIAEYVWSTYSQKAQMPAVLRSAFPLGENIKEALKAILEKRFNKKVKIQAEQDPELLGGIQISIGNKMIDGSVRRGLNDLRENLSLTRVT